MNKIQRILSMLLACLTVLCLATAGLSETLAVNTDPVILTVDGRNFLLSEIRETAEALYEYGYIQDAEDYKEVLGYCVSVELQTKEMSALGLNTFTAEEEQAFADAAQAEYDANMESYFSYYQSSAEMSEEETQDLRDNLTAYFASQGYTLEAVADELRYEAALDRLVEYMKTKGDISVTEEEIQAGFAEAVAQDREMFEGNVSNYELYTMWYGYDAWYIPEGYRSVTFILLPVDEALLEQYETSLAYAEEENADGEENTGEKPAVLTEEEAAEQILSSVQEKTDAIYSRLAAGEAFEQLILEYTLREEGQDESSLTEPVAVHVESMTVSDGLLAAAFDGDMLSPGSVSRPHAASEGVYIAFYKSDIPAGAVEMTEEIRTGIRQQLEDIKLNDIYDELVGEWKQQHDIAYNEDAMREYLGLVIVDGEPAEME